MKRNLPPIILNGEVVSGRTHRNPDGTYESLDLVDVLPGGVLSIITDQGVHELTKGEGGRSAMDGWSRPGGERALGTTVGLVICEPTGTGRSFLTPGVVVRRGLEVGIIEEANKYIIKGTGVIMNIAMRRPPGSEERSVALNKSFDIRYPQ